MMRKFNGVFFRGCHVFGFVGELLLNGYLKLSSLFKEFQYAICGQIMAITVKQMYLPFQNLLILLSYQKYF